MIAPDGGDVESVVAAEAEVTVYLEQYVARHRSAVGHVVRQPRRAASALVAIRRLPLLRVDPPDDVDGAAIRSGLHATIFSRLVLGRLRAVLVLPTDPASYTVGSSRSKHTLRRKIRKAEHDGVVWRLIEDPGQRAELLTIANEHERAHPMPAYRNDAPQNDQLPRFRLWIAAYDTEGIPLLLTVIPHAGSWAVLRYFRVLQETPAASNARYLMMEVLVRQLAERGVRYLGDEASPHLLPGGLRHFQRMVGFRLVRARMAVAHAG